MAKAPEALTDHPSSEDGTIMFRYVSRIFRVCEQVERSRSPRPGKAAILLTYARCKLKHLILVRLFRRALHHERIFGCDVHFFDYSTFILLFEEVFITQQYYFHSGTTRPFVIDCGANIGMALLYFKLMYPKARVLAFEPDELTFRRLQQNVRENSLQDVTLVNAALSNRAGEIEFFTDPANPGMLLMSTIKGRVPRTTPGRMVKAVRLSNYINENVDFVKIDVEGAEIAVLKELSHEGKLECIAAITVEYHHHITCHEDALSRFLRIFEEWGWGYQLCSAVPPTRAGFQDILVYAYAKAPLREPQRRETGCDQRLVSAGTVGAPSLSAP
jgi:FkbM family methyltransferase